LSGSELWTYAYVRGQQASDAYWALTPPSAGYYKIYAYIPDCASNAPHAHYTVNTRAGGGYDTYLDQQSYTKAWALLGEVYAGHGDVVRVRLADDSNPSGTWYVGADAMKLVATKSPCGGSCQPPPPPPVTTCSQYPSGVAGPGCYPDPTFSTDGWWGRGSCGFAGHELWTYAYVAGQQHSYAHWSFPKNPTNSWYKVYAYIPNCAANAPHAHYTVQDGSGQSFSAYVDQQFYTNAWVSLGYVNSGSSGKVNVQLGDDANPPGLFYVGADAMELVQSAGPCPRCT
jgi:hypothetical protein